ASVAASASSKPYAYDGGVRAVQAHCRRVGIDATVTPGAHLGTYRVARVLPRKPLVSVVIPTRGTAGTVWGCHRRFLVDAVRSIVECSTYQELEIVVVADRETPAAVLR